MVAQQDWRAGGRPHKHSQVTLESHVVEWTKKFPHAWWWERKGIAESIIWSWPEWGKLSCYWGLQYKIPRAGATLKSSVFSPSNSQHGVESESGSWQNENTVHEFSSPGPFHQILMLTSDQLGTVHCHREQGSQKYICTQGPPLPLFQCPEYLLGMIRRRGRKLGRPHYKTNKQKSRIFL